MIWELMYRLSKKKWDLQELLGNFMQDYIDHYIQYTIVTGLTNYAFDQQ